MERLFRIRCSAISKIMSNAKIKGELSQTCKTYLHEWYAGDNEQIQSKYLDKGNQVESDLIDFMAIQLGFGMAEKNSVTNSDEYFIGTCDVNLPTCIVDVKASWNRKTLQQQAIEGVNSDYEYQLQGYMHLYKKETAFLFYGLMNTPETNYSQEIIYEDMPNNERWLAYKIDRDLNKIDAIIEKVNMCREYLISYDKLIKSKMGKVNE
jgi:hypothetical protein